MTKTAPPPPMHIVVGVQLDETGDVALAHALDLARRSNARIHLCHAAGAAGPAAASDSDAAERKLTEAEARLATWAAARVFGDPLIARTKVYVDLGEPADVLRRLAADVKAAMIVVGSHRKGPLSRLVEGSVVSTLLAESPCPVVVATPVDYDGVERSPALQAGHAPGDAPRTLGETHRYHYRRRIALDVHQSTVGVGRV